MTLPGYDNWKTTNPDDDRCEHCGAFPYEVGSGWQPSRCNGGCGLSWRDPDAERDAALDQDTEWDTDENDSDAEAWS